MAPIVIYTLDNFICNVKWIHNSNNHHLYANVDLIERHCDRFYLDIILLLYFVVFLQVDCFDFKDPICKVIDANN